MPLFVMKPSWPGCSVQDMYFGIIVHSARVIRVAVKGQMFVLCQCS